MVGGRLVCEGLHIQFSQVVSAGTISSDTFNRKRGIYTVDIHLNVAG